MVPSVKRFVPALNRLILLAAMWMVPASVHLHLMGLPVIKVSFLMGNGLACHKNAFFFFFFHGFGGN